MCLIYNRSYEVKWKQKESRERRLSDRTGMISRVDSARKEHQSLTTENQLLQKYINNSLTSTAVFGATNGAINSNMSLRQAESPK